MTTFYDKLKVQSRLYLDSLTQQDETLQMDLRNFLVDNRRQLMVVQSVISYLMVKDILRNFEKLGANIKSKYSDPTCLTWEQCGSIVKTSKMILTLPKLIILDYNKSDFCSDDSKLLKILLNNDSVHKSTTNKIVIVLSAESKNLTNNFECFLSENYGKLAYSDKKLDLKYRDEVQKANSLIEAASLGNFYQVMHFIDDNSDINMRDKINITALHEAAEKGNAEIVLFLLEHGATQLPNLSNKYPLHLACFNGHNHIVSILIEYGADLAKEDDMKQNALNFASYKDHPNIIETLLYYGVQVDALNSMKDTSLHIAAYAGSFEAVKVLIKNGANRKLLNNENKSAAELAQAHGHQHIADYLNQDEPQEKELIQNDRSNKYPLHLACFNGHNHIVNILIEYGADLAKEDYMKQNALDSASCKDHPNIIETLLHYGAQVDALNSMKETPLHIAAYAGSFEAVKVLIKNGANRKLLNNQNKSAAELAQANGHQHIADYLNQDEPQEKELIQNGQ